MARQDAFPDAVRPHRRPASVSPGRPPKSELEARRRHMLEAAATEFLTRGYADASIARIARAAGMSNKTFYARFPNKDALLLAVAGELASFSLESAVGAMADAEADPENGLLAFGLQIARGWQSPWVVGLYRLVIAEAPRFPELAGMYHTTMAQLRTALANYLREQTKLGTLDIADADAAARQFGMLSFGEVRERALLGEPFSDKQLQAIVRRGVRVFLHGYARR
jgi:AcrR family transcriptional regulator